MLKATFKKSIGFFDAELTILRNTTPTSSLIQEIPWFDNLSHNPRNFATYSNIKNIFSSQVVSIYRLHQSSSALKAIAYNSLIKAAWFHTAILKRLQPPTILGSKKVCHATRAFLDSRVFPVHKNLLQTISTALMTFLDKGKIWAQ